LLIPACTILKIKTAPITLKYKPISDLLIVSSCNKVIQLPRTSKFSYVNDYRNSVFFQKKSALNSAHQLNSKVKHQLHLLSIYQNCFNKEFTSN